MGRQQVFSKAGVDAALEQHRKLTPALFSLSRKLAATPQDAEAAHDAAAAAVPLCAAEDEQLEEFVGTALVLAFLQVGALMPVAQLAQRVSAAKAHFADFTVRMQRRLARLSGCAAWPRPCRSELAHTVYRTDARGLGLRQDADGLCGASSACVRIISLVDKSS
jgi:hypothetical protein